MRLLDYGPWIILAALGILGLYEVVALRFKERHVTISEITWRVAYRHPLLPFAVGMVMGHFFWQATMCVPLLK